ncbi:DUF4244 domain-containing protein [Jatrophihabitans telluris]|uniref:DUF4244 domain-containing protein n=1 Tax=Jatrophihabitans telluris TaxID=2038343 RepID=A0ABY4QXZ9_9ACTN|nr:DUF4244 domain-containing protein [Jatrophihabitans telluris]UQX88142.1 DUF4244 domain-containing protein [Jatrophihabitans telluris]
MGIVFVLRSILAVVSLTVATPVRQWARDRGVREDREAGMTTAEYAVGTVAAVAFAAVLFKIVQSPAVQSALSHIVTSALHGPL